MTGAQASLPRRNILASPLTPVAGSVVDLFYHFDKKSTQQIEPMEFQRI